jgi:hypothetical protein
VAVKDYGNALSGGPLQSLITYFGKEVVRLRGNLELFVQSRVRHTSSGVVDWRGSPYALNTRRSSQFVYELAFTVVPGN